MEVIDQLKSEIEALKAENARLTRDLEIFEQMAVDMKARLKLTPRVPVEPIRFDLPTGSPEQLFNFLKKEIEKNNAAILGT